MNNTQLLKTYAAQQTKLRIRLRLGKIFTGVITSVGEDYIILHDKFSQEALIRLDDVSYFEPLPEEVAR